MKAAQALRGKFTRGNSVEHISKTRPCCLVLHQQKSTFLIPSYSILFHLTTSYSSYFGGKKGISRNKTSFFLLMLLMNPSAIKRAHSDVLKNKWTNSWRQSERGQKMHKINDTTLSKRFLKAISTAEISCSSASLISQLRINHIPLNSYLKQIKRVDSAQCPTCGADVEDTTHFLLTCPTYTYERWALARLTRKAHKPLSLELLLGDPSMVIPLAKYIAATHRFDKPGESPSS